MAIQEKGKARRRNRQGDRRKYGGRRRTKVWALVWGDLKAEFMLFMFYFALVKKSIHESFGIWFLLGASKKKEEKRRMKQKEEGEEDEKEKEEEKKEDNWWHWSWVLAFLFPSALKMTLRWLLFISELCCSNHCIFGEKKLILNYCIIEGCYLEN